MNNSFARMACRSAIALLLFGTLVFLAAGNSLAQLEPLQEQMESEITAQARLFPGVGPGVRAIKRDRAGRYYILSAPGSSVLVFSASEKARGKIPARAKGPGAIVYGADMDVDPSGRVYVADRGGNAVKVYSPAGQLILSIPVRQPTSVAALAGGEIAVSSFQSSDLVTIYDMAGKDVREFGALSTMADRADLNRLLSLGRLGEDPAGNLYYAFTYFPEPTFRKYNRFGYSKYEMSLTTLDIYPSAQAQRRTIARIEEENGPPVLEKVITAIGVDPATEDVWIALGDDLMKFDKNGNRLAKYRTLTTGGEDLSSSAILVGPRHLLLGDDPLGIFQFARPDLPEIPSAKTK